MGPKFRLNDVQRAEARQRLANGEAAQHLAKLYGVSRATIYRVCLQERASRGARAAADLPLASQDSVPPDAARRSQARMNRLAMQFVS
jgi:hypothetical protein